MNKDGINDVELVASHNNYDHSFYGTFAAIPLNGGGVVGGNRGPLGPYASALAKGAILVPRLISQVRRRAARSQWNASQDSHLEAPSSPITGLAAQQPALPWCEVCDQWQNIGSIQMTMIPNEELAGTVTEYAYETVPNKEIGAGATTDATVTGEEARTQPAIRCTNGPSLGMLALGLGGLSGMNPRIGSKAPLPR